MEKNLISINKLKEAFFSLKANKIPGYDNIDSNVVKKSFGEINKPLQNLFNLSLQNGTFPEKMKIAEIISLFKNGDLENIANYRPICFFLFFLTRACNVSLVIQICVEIIILKAIWIPKRSFYRPCYCPPRWSNLRVLWKW